MSASQRSASKLLWISFLLTGALSTSCQFKKLGNSLEQLDELSMIRIEIEETTGSNQPILVILAQAETGKRVNRSVIYGVGHVELYCEPGEYLVGALEDMNEDFAYQKGEPLQFFGDLEPVPVAAGETREIGLNLGRSATKLDPRTQALYKRRLLETPLMKVSTVVRYAKLDDAQFAYENTELGGWEPAKFIERGYPGIYLLEKHDPERTPVLFVHGVYGTPRDFKTALDELDRTRFQPWVYYYPSSLRLEQVGDHLLREMSLLVTELKSKKIILVCYSMGGLVGRNAVAKYTRAGLDYLRTFVTICSPLGGISSAAAGANWAPVPMPCWYDLSPGSPFLNELFTTPLPDGLPYHMVFGFAKGDGDGVVPMKSQLRDEALDQSVSRIGAAATHKGILDHPRLLRLLDSL